MKRNILHALLAVTVLFLGFSVAAADSADKALGNVADEPELSPTPYQQILYPTFFRPGMVQVYAVECSEKGGIKFRIRDCCIAGDRWEVLGKIADSKPAVGMLTGTGSTIWWRATAIDGENSVPLRGLIQVRYCHGVNIFPASANLDIMCTNQDAVLNVTDLGQFPDISK